MHIHILRRLALAGALSLVLVAQVFPALAACTDPLIDKDCIQNSGEIPLMQPLDDSTNALPVRTEPLQIFYDYFNMSWPWLLGVASGIAVLQAVWGGVQIMTSIDQDGGKERIRWALGGMVMITLVGFILRTLNSMFYA